MTVLTSTPVSIDVVAPVIHFTNVSTDRAEIRVNGAIFGDAIANEFGGWFVVQGRFPNARRFPQADGNDLAEVRRELAKAISL